MTENPDPGSSERLAPSDAEFAWHHPDSPGALIFEHAVPQEIAAAISSSVAQMFPPLADPAAEYRGLQATAGVAGR